MHCTIFAQYTYLIEYRVSAEGDGLRSLSILIYINYDIRGTRKKIAKALLSDLKVGF